MKIKIKKLNPNAIIPKQGTEYSAGYDLYACMDDFAIIWSNDTIKIPTGIALEIPKGYFGAIYARSSLATKQGLRPANCVGIIDSDYRGEIIVALHNDNKRNQRIEFNERIAQIVIQPYLSIEFEEVDELDSTIRGDGGFGSTGKV